MFPLILHNVVAQAYPNLTLLLNPLLIRSIAPTRQPSVTPTRIRSAPYRPKELSEMSILMKPADGVPMVVAVVGTVNRTEISSSPYCASSPSFSAIKFNLNVNGS